MCPSPLREPNSFIDPSMKHMFRKLVSPWHFFLPFCVYIQANIKSLHFHLQHGSTLWPHISFPTITKEQQAAVVPYLKWTPPWSAPLQSLPSIAGRNRKHNSDHICLPHPHWNTSVASHYSYGKVKVLINCLHQVNVCPSPYLQYHLTKLTDISGAPT